MQFAEISKAAAHSPETVLVQKGLAAHPFFGGVQGATLSSRNVWDLRISGVQNGACTDKFGRKKLDASKNVICPKIKPLLNLGKG